MKIELDLPEEMLEDFYRRSGERGLSVHDYAAELLFQAVAHNELGDIGKIENRPDWQAALDRARADFAAGRVIPHEEVAQWHRDHPESSGPKDR